MNPTSVDYELLLDKIIQAPNPYDSQYDIMLTIRDFFAEDVKYRPFSIHSGEDGVIFNKILFLITKKYGYGFTTAKSTSYFSLNESWKQAIKKGGHFKYQEHLKEIEKNKTQDEIEIRQLRKAELEARINEIFDCKKVQDRARCANIISVTAIVVTVIGIIIQWQGCTK